MTREKKTITDMVREKKKKDALNVEAVEKATAIIHNDVVPAKTVKTPKSEKLDIQDEKIPVKRVSVDVPVPIHNELKKLMIDLNTDLKTFFYDAVKEKVKKKGYNIQM